MLQTIVSSSVSGGTVVTNELPAGDIDGVNTVFTLANSPIGDTLKVYLNGISQLDGPTNDYTIVSVNQVQFNDAPLAGDVVKVDYEY